MDVKPDEGAVVVVGPFHSIGRLRGSEPLCRIALFAEGVRRYGEHNGEIIPYVDCRGEQGGILEFAS